MSKLSKTAKASMKGAAGQGAAVAVIPDAEMLRILRINQKARIFTGNMEFIDGALRALDAEVTAANAKADALENEKQTLLDDIAALQLRVSELETPATPVTDLPPAGAPDSSETGSVESVPGE